MKSCSLLGCGALIILLAPSLVCAAALVTFNFNDQNLIPDDYASHVTASSITGGTGSSFSYNRDAAGDYSLVVSSWGTSSFPAAIAANDTFTFSVAPQTGYYLDLASISMGARTIGAGGGLFQVQYSFNDGGTYQTAIPSATSGSSWQTHNGTLNDQVMNRTLTTVLFRVSGYTASSIRFDDIVVYGSINAVPAPGAAVLLLGGLGLEALRRRRNKRRTVITNERH